MKTNLITLLILLLISCSKEKSGDNFISNPTYELIVLASTGGNTSFDNPNNGIFEEGTEVNITAVAEENYLFTEWSNGSRENPLI